VLLRAVASGEVCRDGTGRRNEAYRYWLPQKEEEWKQDPWYEMKEQLEAERAAVEGGEPGGRSRLGGRGARAQVRPDEWAIGGGAARRGAVALGRRHGRPGRA